MTALFSLSDSDLSAIWLTLKLATTVTIILLVLATPLAWWLASSQSRLRHIVSTVVALPLVLPPTVIGFYLLLLMGPNGPVGHLTETLGIGLLPFSFWGLVVASLVYSLPFVVQPIQQAMESIEQITLEAAATLRAGASDRFFSIVLPLSKPGFITAAIMGFAHTIGEFGVVLMIGGSIAGETRVVSVALYEHVETLQYGNAHGLAAVLVIFSFLILLPIYITRRQSQPFSLRAAIK